MKDLYDRIVWTAIAVALVVIAMNPWIAPGILNAQSGIVRVDLVRYRGEKLGLYNPVEVEVVRGR